MNVDYAQSDDDMYYNGQDVDGGAVDAQDGACSAAIAASSHHELMLDIEPPPAEPMGGNPYVRIEYHPSAGLQEKLIAFDEYFQHPRPNPLSPLPESSTSGVQSRIPRLRSGLTYEDFNFAEYCFKTGLSNREIDNLLARSTHVWFQPESCKLSFNSHKDLLNVYAAHHTDAIAVSVLSLSYWYSTHH
jgi:hypothetical protein